MQRKTKRLAAASVVVTAAAVVLFTLPTGKSSGPPAATTTELPYAYLTDGDYAELVVMHGDKVVARTPRTSDGLYPDENQVVWTFDGQHVAVLSKLWDLTTPDGDLVDISDQIIIEVDVRTGTILHLPCPNCASIAPTGDHEITGLDRKSHHLLRFDLASKTPTTPIVGASVSSIYYDRLVAGLPDAALVDASNALTTNPPEHLYIARRGGSSLDFGFTSLALSMPAASTQKSIYGKPEIAVQVTPTDPCASDRVLLIDGQSGKPAETDFSAVQEAGAVDLWWDPAGYLHAIMASPANDPNGCKYLSPGRSSVWRLDPQLRWVLERPAAGGPRSIERPLDQNTKLVLVGGSDPYSATLYMEKAGQRTQVATNVLLISTIGGQGDVIG